MWKTLMLFLLLAIPASAQQWVMEPRVLGNNGNYTTTIKISRDVVYRWAFTVRGPVHAIIRGKTTHSGFASDWVVYDSISVLNSNGFTEFTVSVTGDSLMNLWLPDDSGSLGTPGYVVKMRPNWYHTFEVIGMPTGNGGIIGIADAGQQKYTPPPTNDDYIYTKIGDEWVNKILDSLRNSSSASKWDTSQTTLFPIKPRGFDSTTFRIYYDGSFEAPRTTLNPPYDAFGDYSTFKWYSRKGALRAGLDSTNWEDSKVGYASIVLGGGLASANGAISIGSFSTVDGQQAIALGGGNYANGEGSVTIGNANSTTATRSIALGTNSSATAFQAVAIGSVKAALPYSVIVGVNNDTTSPAVFAVGNGSTIGVGTRKNAFEIMPDGSGRISLGAWSDGAFPADSAMIVNKAYLNDYVAEQIANIPIPPGTAAWTVDTTLHPVDPYFQNLAAIDSLGGFKSGQFSLTGLGSFSLGDSNISIGYASSTIGKGVIATEAYQFAVGSYNDTTETNKLFTVGNGSVGSRRNAFQVYKTGTAKIQTGPWGIDSNLVVNKGYVDTRVSTIDLSPYALKTDSSLFVSMNRDDVVQGEKTFAGQVNGVVFLSDSIITPLIRTSTTRLSIEWLRNTAVDNQTAFSLAEIGGTPIYSVTTQNATLGRYKHVMANRTGSELIRFDPNYGNAGASISASQGLNLVSGSEGYGQVKVRSTGVAITPGGSPSDTHDSTLTVYGSLRLKAGGAVVNGKGPNLRVDGKIHGYDSAVINGNVSVSSTTSSYNVRTDSLRLGLGLNMSKQPTASIVAENSVESNISIALQPKGTGAFYLGPKADGTATGGNARGQDAIDLQLGTKGAATMVASGNRSIAIGGANSASGIYSTAIGYQNTTSAQSAVALGRECTSSGIASVALGYKTTASGSTATSSGDNSSAVGVASVAIGNRALANDTAQAAFGQYCDTVGVHLLTVGNGTGAAERRNAFEVFRNGDRRGAEIGSKFSDMVIHLQDTTGNAVTDTLTRGFPTQEVGTARFAVIDSGFVWTYSALVSARSDMGQASGWKIEGVIQRVGATTSMVGTPTITTLGATAGAATWAVNAVADDTNDALHILVTGSAATLIRWHASVTISMCGF